MLMKRSSPNIRATGAQLEVEIRIGSEAANILFAANLPITEPIKTVSLIDSGAISTLIQEGMGEKLGLKPISYADIITPSNQKTKKYPCYRVNIQFPSGDAFDTSAVEMPLRFQGIGCLLGLDILIHAEFVLNGPEKRFSLQFQD